jgi:hypothetical protein
MIVHKYSDLEKNRHFIHNQETELQEINKVRKSYVKPK